MATALEGRPLGHDWWRDEPLTSASQSEVSLGFSTYGQRYVFAFRGQAPGTRLVQRWMPDPSSPLESARGFPGGDREAGVSWGEPGPGTLIQGCAATCKLTQEHSTSARTADKTRPPNKTQGFQRNWRF